MLLVSRVARLPVTKLPARTASGSQFGSFAPARHERTCATFGTQDPYAARDEPHPQQAADASGFSAMALWASFYRNSLTGLKKNNRWLGGDFFKTVQDSDASLFTFAKFQNDVNFIEK